MASATMPNFLVLGAAKAGTTSLWTYLDQHPEVYVPGSVKETNFFAFEGEEVDFGSPDAQRRINRFSITDIDVYQALFKEVSTETAIGEVSPLYLYSQKAPERIRHHIPEAKLIAVLRNPVERAYSSFLHLVRNGREPFDDFARGLEAEQERIRIGWEWIWHYQNVGFYHEQLQRYYERFEQEQIRVYLYEDLVKDPVAMLQDVYGFLGVDSSFVPDTSLKYKVSGVPRSRGLYKIFTRPNPLKSGIKTLVPRRFRRRISMGLQHRMLVKPPFPDEIRGRLIEGYEKDIRRLEGLIQRDLSGWLR